MKRQIFDRRIPKKRRIIKFNNNDSNESCYRPGESQDGASASSLPLANSRRTAVQMVHVGVEKPSKILRPDLSNVKNISNIDGFIRMSEDN